MASDGAEGFLFAVRYFDEISRRRRRLEVWPWRRLTRETLGFQTTQKSAQKTSTTPSYEPVLSGQNQQEHAIETFVTEIVRILSIRVAFLGATRIILRVRWIHNSSGLTP